MAVKSRALLLHLDSFDPDFAVGCKICPEGADESPSWGFVGVKPDQNV